MNQIDTTNQLIRRAKAGDAAAVDQLFTAHRRYLRRLIEVRMEPELARRVDASDVVQEAQIRAIQRFSAYLEKQEIEFRPWLRAQALDRLVELRRFHLGSAKRALHREATLPRDSSALLVRQLLRDSPSEQAVRQETIQAVREAVGQLRDDDRELLVLRHFEGLSNNETAQVLGIEPAAASKRFGRVLLKLHQQLVLSGVVSQSSRRDQ